MNEPEPPNPVERGRQGTTPPMDKGKVALVVLAVVVVGAGSLALAVSNGWPWWGSLAAGTGLAALTIELFASTDNAKGHREYDTFRFAEKTLAWVAGAALVIGLFFGEF